MAEKTTAKVKNGVAYYEGESFTLSNIDKVKIIDLSRYTGYTYSRSDNDLIISHYGTCITIKDYFGANGTVASTVKTLRIYDNGQKKGYKDYNLTTSGLLNHIDSGVETFDIKKGVITGTPFADIISAADFDKPTGKNKNTGVTIKTGFGNDNVTGSAYNDTFNINGSGAKTINIKATDGNDIIKGVNTKNTSLVLNLSNTVLDNTTNAAANATYEKVGNDLKITASETVPAKIENLNNYIWYKQYMGYDSTTGKSIYQYGVCTPDDPHNFYEYSPHSFETPLYSYQDGNDTKYTEYRDVTHTLADCYLLVGHNAYDGHNDSNGTDYLKIFTSLEAANAFKDSYYDEDNEQPYGEGHDTCEITKLSGTDNPDGILYSYKVINKQVYSLTAPIAGEPIEYSDMYLHREGDTYVSYYQHNVDYYSIKTEKVSDEDITISELQGDIYYQNGRFYIESPYYGTITTISNDNFDTTYYLSPELFFVTDYHEYDVTETYYKYNEQNYYYVEGKAPTEITGNCTITDTEAPEYTTIDTIYSYVKDGSMAYTFDAQTANYVEGATAPASSTTIIKDYFKNLIAPDVEIGLKDVKLLDALNKTDLVNIDRSAQTKKQTINGTFLNDVITGGQGNDTINLSTSDSVTGDRVNAGKGTDTINIKSYGKKVITIGNEDGNDTIKGTGTYGAYTFLNYTDIDVDSVNDAKNNLEYTRSKNNLVIKRTYTVDGKEKTSTTTIKDYFKNTSSTPSVYFGDGLNTYVSLFNVLNGFNAGTKGTHLNDILTGTKKADKITTGRGTDVITGGKGNDKITIDGNGSKYIVMNTGDGVDTVSTKVNDYIYLQFTGAGITGSDTARTNLTYEKSGKNDIKITNTIESSAIMAPSGYISNSGIGTDKVTFYFTTGTHSYYTEITDATGLYSYEADGETRYTTAKNETKQLSTVKLVINTSENNLVGFITDSDEYEGEYFSPYYSTTSLSGKETLYAYKCKNYTGNYEYAYSINQVTATKYSDLWLKSNGSYGQYNFVREYTDGCIAVNSRTAIYTGRGFVSLERMYEGQEEVSQDRYNSTYFIDNDHLQVVDIDNNKNTPIYKTYDISNSYYLQLPNGVYGTLNDKGMAITSALTEDSYTKIENIYKTTDDEGKIVYSIEKPKGFKESSTSTSVIVKDYLTKEQSVLVTNSNNTSNASWVSDIVNNIGVNIGNAKSKKAQKLTGSKLNDNIFGGSGKDKITTGASNSWDRGDIITPGKGNDTITINGNGNKTINIANKDGNDTIIFTDNNKKTKYDYTTSKRLYLNFDNDAELTYKMKGKDLVITRSYDIGGGKTGSATTTLKDYFNVDYKSALARNIYINNSLFDPSEYFDNKEIDKSSGKKAQKINGNMFNNTIIGGSANDTINGGGGSDRLDGGKGSDTYVVNYNSGSKHYLGDKIIISDTGTGAKDVDTLKLDVKKKDMALLFNVNKISDSSDYTDNDIIVGSGDNTIHYSYDNQLMIFADIEQMDEGVRNNSGKFTSAYGIIADGLEKITTSDKKTVTLNNIKSIAQDVANWLSSANGGSGYDNAADVFESGNPGDLITMLAKYNPDNAVIKNYMDNM